MEVSKGQLINGVIKYIKNDVLKKIPDKPFRMTLSAAVNLMEAKPEVADIIFEHPILKGNDGMFDIDLLEQVILKTIEEYGDFPVTIPPVRFISPTEKELRFTAEDVKKLKGYIEG